MTVTLKIQIRVQQGDSSAHETFLRARDSLAYSAYGNSVLVSVTTRYRSKLRWDRDLQLTPYDSSESLVVCNKILCH